MLCTQMNVLSEKQKLWGIRVGVVALFSLVGYSFSRLPGFPSEDGYTLALVGAAFAAIAIFIAAMLRPATQRIEKSRPPKQFIGLKIMTVSFIVALCGWLVAVLVHGRAGFVLVVLGIFGGFIGIVVHLVNLFGDWRRA
jgi:hypothetical protein